MANFFRHNLSLKIVSIIAAIVIWAAVRMQTDPIVEQRMAISVSPIRVPEGMAVIRVTPPEISLTVRGRSSVLSRDLESMIRLTVDLSAGEIGVRSMPVGVGYKPQGLEIVRWDRKMVQVELDSVITEKRAVQANTRGRTAEGFVARGWQVQPNEVTVTGPGADVRRVVEVVAVIDISEKSSTIKRQIEPQARDENNVQVENVRIEPSKVTVTIPIESVDTRTVPIKPVIGPVPQGYELVSVTRSPNTVTISGRPEQLARVQALDTARVDISDLRDESAYSVQLDVPQGISVIGASSVRVTVKVRKARPKSQPSTLQNGANATPDDGATSPDDGGTATDATTPESGGSGDAGTTDATGGQSDGASPSVQPGADGSGTGSGGRSGTGGGESGHRGI